MKELIIGLLFGVFIGAWIVVSHGGALDIIGYSKEYLLVKWKGKLYKLSEVNDAKEAE